LEATVRQLILAASLSVLLHFSVSVAQADPMLPPTARQFEDTYACGAEHAVVRWHYLQTNAGFRIEHFEILKNGMPWPGIGDNDPGLAALAILTNRYGFLPVQVRGMCYMGLAVPNIVFEHPADGRMLDVRFMPFGGSKYEFYARLHPLPLLSLSDLIAHLDRESSTGAAAPPPPLVE
jgi:hypothetical protein